MLHYVEMINDEGADIRPGVPLLALAKIPIDGEIVGVDVTRETATAFGGGITYDIRTGANSSSLDTIFANPAHRPVIPFGTLGPASANSDAFPVACTANHSVGFYRVTSSPPGGAGTRPTAIVIIDDGLLNEKELPPVVTGSLANLAEANLTAPLGKSFVLTAIEVDRAARVTVYRSPAYRTADASRPIGTLPEGDHGVIVDVNITSAAKLNLTPIMYGATAEAPRSGDIAIRVQNRSGATSTVAVKFTENKLEA